jgi:two-component system, NarL family, nitrate/nitrite response regulator NarL
MIRLLVVDEVRLMGNAFETVLNQEPDIDVVGCATGVSEALPLVERCNMLLVSTTLPENGAWQLTRTVVHTHPSARVVVVGFAAGKLDILRYVEAGAAGYVLKEGSLAEMLGTLRAVHSRQALVSPDVAAVLMSRVAQLAAVCKTAGARRYTPPELTATLTPREREVLRLMAQNLSNTVIAERLTIELGTVKNHVHNILAKMNVSSRRDAIEFLARRKRQSPSLAEGEQHGPSPAT